MQEHTNALYRIAPLWDDACIELPYMGHTRPNFDLDIASCRFQSLGQAHGIVA